jgi:hypothetical protein
MEVKSGHYSACWFWEEVHKEADQDEIARAHGHPEPSQGNADVNPEAPELGVSPSQSKPE